MYSDIVRRSFSVWTAPFRYGYKVITAPAEGLSSWYRHSNADRVNELKERLSLNLKTYDELTSKAEEVKKLYDDLTLNARLVKGAIKRDLDELDKYKFRENMIKYGTNAAVLSALGYGGYKLYKKWKKHKDLVNDPKNDTIDAEYYHVN